MRVQRCVRSTNLTLVLCCTLLPYIAACPGTQQRFGGVVMAVFIGSGVVAGGTKKSFLSSCLEMEEFNLLFPFAGVVYMIEQHIP